MNEGWYESYVIKNWNDDTSRLLIPFKIMIIILAPEAAATQLSSISYIKACEGDGSVAAAVCLSLSVEIWSCVCQPARHWLVLRHYSDCLPAGWRQTHKQIWKEDGVSIFHHRCFSFISLRLCFTCSSIRWAIPLAFLNKAKIKEINPIWFICAAVN